MENNSGSPDNVRISSQDSQQRSISPDGKYTRLLGGGKPSTKYSHLSPPSAVDMHKATQPPQRALLKQPNQRTWMAALKERVPMRSTLTGEGKAGKYGELVAQNGVHYYGEVLAGRPHGYGEYWRPKGNTLGQEIVLFYEGNFVQGRQEGHGTKYYTNGECYTGEFLHNQRHGFGTHTYRNGNVYEGEWDNDQRNGHGRMIYKNGDVFVGNFVDDIKEGLGTLYRLNSRQKQVAEYIHGQPCCATVLDLDSHELAPLDDELQRNTFETNKRFGVQIEKVADLPELDISQPYKIINNEISTLRNFREKTISQRSQQILNNLYRTLDYSKMEVLRHSFTLLAGGDAKDSHLLVHQLKDLFLLSGLDPAQPGTGKLMKEIVKCQQRDGRIILNEFLRVITHFAEQQ